MRAFLRRGEHPIPHLHHIKVIKPARLRIRRDARIIRRDLRHRVPVIRDVAADAPAVADGRAPRVDRVGAPVAEAVQDGPPRREQRGRHGLVPRLRVAARRRAVVVLPVVDAPRRELRGVDGLVAERPREAGAGAGPGVAVEPEFEAQRVDLVGDGLDALREFGWVRREGAAAGVAGAGAPAVVQVDVCVAEFAEAEGDEEIGGVDGVGGGRGKVAVVVVPPHGGGEADAIEETFGVRWRSGDRNTGEGEEQSCSGEHVGAEG